MPLISTANMIATTDGDDTLTGTSGADSYIIDNSTSTGKDTLTVGANDTMLFTQQLYDGNGDGIITYGSDKRLDTTADGLGSDDEINTIGIKFNKGVRYLGEKDGYFVYASAVVKPTGSIEGSVNDDTLHATSGDDVFFYDTALGLNLGNDTIVGAGNGDQLVTTSAIYDGDSDGVIRFQSTNYGQNGILDLPGATGGTATDPNDGPGGSIDFDTSVELAFAGTTTANGVTYYHYDIVEI